MRGSTARCGAPFCGWVSMLFYATRLKRWDTVLGREMEQEREDRGEGHEKGARASFADESPEAMVDVGAIGAKGRGAACHAREGGGEKIEKEHAEEDGEAKIGKRICRERREGRGGFEGKDGEEGEISHRKAERGRACVAEEKDGARTVVGKKAEEQSQKCEGNGGDALIADG